MKHSLIEQNFMTYDFDKAKSGLNSPDLVERFKSVTYFIRNIHPEIRKNLELCRREERVRHIKMALDKAIYNLGTTVPQSEKKGFLEHEAESEEQLKRYLKSQAIDEFSGVILHELAPKVGLIDSSLKGDFSDYEGSRAQKHVFRLLQMFQAIECLRKSTHKPESKETDLHQLIKDIVSDELANYPENTINVSLQGMQPCIIYSDSALLNLVLSNGIRNSIESLFLTRNTDHSTRNIILSWGVSDTDSWISIIDNGLGVQGNPKEAFKIGNTNKDGHIGFGMGIMKQAMESLGGYAELSNIDNGGAKLLLRWGNV